jgi:hypothetical protein
MRETDAKFGRRGFLSDLVYPSPPLRTRQSSFESSGHTQTMEDKQASQPPYAQLVQEGDGWDAFCCQLFASNIANARLVLSVPPTPVPLNAISSDMRFMPLSCLCWYSFSRNESATCYP